MAAIDDNGAAIRAGSAGWAGCSAAAPTSAAVAPAAPPALARTPPDIELLDAVISGMPDPVVVLDHDGRVLAFNPQAAAIAPALRRGEPASIALRMPELVEAIRAATADRQGAAHRVLRAAAVAALVGGLRRADALGWHGRAGVVVITVHDLTPIRRVEEMRADFVANASHELRTPLAAITGFIDTLQGPARDDPAARERFLGIMQAQAWRMARLIDDLLSLSRIELRAHQRPDTPVDLVPIVRQVVDGLQTLARDRDVDDRGRRRRRSRWWCSATATS